MAFLGEKIIKCGEKVEDLLALAAPSDQIITLYITLLDHQLNNKQSIGNWEPETIFYIKFIS